MVRMPDGMRDRIARAAAAAGRSMNAEIVNRLQQSFDEEAHRSQPLALLYEAHDRAVRLSPDQMASIEALSAIGSREGRMLKRLSELYDEAERRAEAEMAAEIKADLAARRKS